MQEKDIKRLVKKQLKRKFPHWRLLPRKEKKRLAEQALTEASSSYPYDKEVEAPLNELTGTPAVPAGVIALGEMAAFVAESKRGLLRLSRALSQKHVKDRELKAIDCLLDDDVLDRLLAGAGYTPSKRKIFPHQLLRAELLKSLKYPEFSYRKFCGQVLNDMEKKTERAFVHLPLHKKLTISHIQLSQFRSSLALSQLINLTVYMIHLLLESGKIEHPFLICGVDSSELPAISNSFPLATLEVGDKKVRIYSDLDADCGKRRNKRDKSKYFVGYRAHTLAAIDPATGHNYPLFSLIAPGNHHDQLLLPQLMDFAQAMGLETKIITADEAYGDAGQNAALARDHGVSVVTPPSQKVKAPEHVDGQSGLVYCDEFCETAMDYLGRTETGHEFKCGADGDCPRSAVCCQHREVGFDSGLFGRIPKQVAGLDDALAIRKHMERAYNLLKHREGLEPLRVRSQSGVMSVATFAHASTLLLEIVGTRRTKEKEGPVQRKLDLAS